ncbi:MAG: lipase maturation factor family protein [Alphaproteobacteria bacterium]|nr:lipase maturation factor family protein [Alphaproteobacteria bacterium]
MALVAWASLGVQVQLLIGPEGLLPVGPWLDALSARGEVGFTALPTWMWWLRDEWALTGGVFLGAGLCVAALVGLAPRLCFAVSGALYLGQAVACRDFLSFQWDNLLIECCFVAALIARDHRDRVGSLLLRLLLFKLYFESGLAKWQSHLGDWQDLSAMHAYYETAPLPTALAWFAHHLPGWWHDLESAFTLFFELLLPFAIFGPRKARLAAGAVFTLFQLVNIATANYGFFPHLALVLHISLLEDRDVARLNGWLSSVIPMSWASWKTAPPPSRARRRLHAALVGPLAALWLLASVGMGLARFADVELLPALWAPLRPFRVANNYHLFGHITTERVEPQFETLAGGVWVEHDMHYKPGSADRAPPFVSPHQPRVDFRLWFYGLAFRRGHPGYVRALVERLCHNPAAVQPLFATDLPAEPVAVRIGYWDYRFTEALEDGWWTRTLVDRTEAIPCAKVPGGDGPPPDRPL